MLGSGCGSVGRLVASDSSLNTVIAKTIIEHCFEDKNKEKETGNCHFFKKTKKYFDSQHLQQSITCCDQSWNRLHNFFKFIRLLKWICTYYLLHSTYYIVPTTYHGTNTIATPRVKPFNNEPLPALPRLLPILSVQYNFCRKKLRELVKVAFELVDTWLTEFRIDRIRVVLQKGYVLYV